MYLTYENDEISIEFKEGREEILTKFKTGLVSNVNFNDELKLIGSGVFYNNKIENIDLKNVEYIYDDAFSRNNINGVLIIPNSVKYIGKNAFSNNFIKEVIVCNPDTVIEKDAFYNNPGIKIRKKQNSKKLLLSMMSNIRCS